jgi:hypothetical protein
LAIGNFYGTQGWTGARSDRARTEAGVQEAADYFEVSEYLVISALVSNGKISRNRLPVDLL